MEDNSLKGCAEKRAREIAYVQSHRENAIKQHCLPHVSVRGAISIG